MTTTPDWIVGAVKDWLKLVGVDNPVRGQVEEIAKIVAHHFAETGLVEAVREILCSPAEFEDERIAWTPRQVNDTDWEELRAALKRATEGGGGNMTTIPDWAVRGARDWFSEARAHAETTTNLDNKSRDIVLAATVAAENKLSSTIARHFAETGLVEAITKRKNYADRSFCWHHKLCDEVLNPHRKCDCGADDVEAALKRATEGT